MATPSEVQTLISDARCYPCFAGREWYVVLAALIDVRDGNPVPTNTNELLAEAVCLQCIPPGMVPAVMVNLLRGIAGGSGVGSREVYSGIWDNPNGFLVPDDPTRPARYSQLESAGGTGVEWHWQTDDLSWA